MQVVLSRKILWQKCELRISTPKLWTLTESTVFITYSERTERLGSQSAALLLRLRSACHFLHRGRHDGWRLHQMSNRIEASRLKTDGRVTVTANALTQEELRVCLSVCHPVQRTFHCLSVLKTPLVKEEGRDQDQWRWPSRLVSTKLCYTGSTPPSVQPNECLCYRREKPPQTQVPYLSKLIGHTWQKIDY